ncbi:MAG: type II toxin-antitoxin system HicA family toxin [Clostridia bacterium]|nr:type II toxin-antitoxin system HicA family toxin [Clostridia bacterium]
MNTYDDVIAGKRDRNIRFVDLCKLVCDLGFAERVRGSHHVFTKPGLPIITLQADGANAKAYQVRQVRKMIHQYGLEV